MITTAPCCSWGSLCRIILFTLAFVLSVFRLFTTWTGYLVGNLKLCQILCKLEFAKDIHQIIGIRSLWVTTSDLLHSIQCWELGIILYNCLIILRLLYNSLYKKNIGVVIIWNPNNHMWNTVHRYYSFWLHLWYLQTFLNELVVKLKTFKEYLKLLNRLYDIT